MRGIVIARGQKGHTQEAPRRRARKVRKRKGVVAGIGFVYESEANGMKGSQH